MAELELVGFNSPTAIEAPQGANTYVAKKAVRFEQPITADQPINGREVDVDGTKLDLITVTSPADLDALIAAVGGLGAIVTLVGVWDPTSGQFPASTVAGESWIVGNTASVDGVDFTLDDRILAITNGASLNVFAGNWHKLDYSNLITSVAGRVGVIVLTEADIDDLQAYLLAASIDSLAKLNALVLDATLIDTTDARLSDARTPTAHEHVPTMYTVATLPVGTVGQIAQVSDGDALLAYGDVVVNTGAGVTPYLVWYNSNDWTVFAE